MDFTAFQIFFYKKKKIYTTYNGQEKVQAKIYSSLDISFKPLSSDGIGGCE